jgi:hypothetical protein
MIANKQLITLAKFSGCRYRQTMDLLFIDGYGFNVPKSLKFLFEVWRKYRDIDKTRLHMIERNRIEYAILNESIESALILLAQSIEKL